MPEEAIWASWAGPPQWPARKVRGGDDNGFRDGRCGVRRGRERARRLRDGSTPALTTVPVDLHDQAVDDQESVDDVVGLDVAGVGITWSGLAASLRLVGEDLARRKRSSARRLRTKRVSATMVIGWSRGGRPRTGARCALTRIAAPDFFSGIELAEGHMEAKIVEHVGIAPVIRRRFCRLRLAADRRRAISFWLAGAAGARQRP